VSGYINWSALASIVMVGLMAGAGLPALFALGIRALSGEGSHDLDGRRPPIRLAAAVLSLAIVIGAIMFAIKFIVDGRV
jgi:hypothetical protein